MKQCRLVKLFPRHSCEGRATVAGISLQLCYVERNSRATVADLRKSYVNFIAAGMTAKINFPP